VAQEAPKGKPGEIVEVRKKTFAIQTGEGQLLVNSLQLEGKKRMTAEDFLRGYPLQTGTILS